MLKNGTYVIATHKYSGTKFDGKIADVKYDVLQIVDENDDIHEISTRFWDIETAY